MIAAAIAGYHQVYRDAALAFDRTVLSRDGDEISVLSRRLSWDGVRPGLADPSVERVRVSVGGLSFLPDVAVGDQVALHWDWLSDWLTADQVETLEASTLRQLEATNSRLVRVRVSEGAR